MSDTDQILLIATLSVVVVALILLTVLLWLSYKRRYTAQGELAAATRPNFY